MLDGATKTIETLHVEQEDASKGNRILSSMEVRSELSVLLPHPTSTSGQ